MINRKRFVHIDELDETRGLLTIETQIITSVVRHHHHNHHGKPLKRLGGIESRNSINLGLVTRQMFVDLVKPIYLADVDDISKQINSGVPLDQITYSSWSCDSTPNVKVFTNILTEHEGQPSTSTLMNKTASISFPYLRSLLKRFIGLH